MLTNPETLLRNFLINLKAKYGLVIERDEIVHELCKAPVDKKKLKLPSGMGAVYIFSLSEGSTSPAGPNRALKVGKVGPNSLARFRYHHYKPGSANSTLAGSIKWSSILWEHIGLSGNANTKIDFGDWLIENTDRNHFFMDASGVFSDSKKFYPLDLLEVYLKGILGPVFEG